MSKKICYQFSTNHTNLRTGECTTSIYLIVEGHFSNPYYSASAGERFRLRNNWIKTHKILIATVPGVIPSYEQEEWTELLNDECYQCLLEGEGVLCNYCSEEAVCEG